MVVNSVTRKIKVVNYLGAKIGSGGIESFVTSVAEKINDYDIDFVLCVNYRNDSIYQQRLTDNEVEVVYLGNKKSYLYNLKKLYIYLKRNRNVILHLHASTGGMYLHAFLAKICGVNDILYHIHSIKSPKYTIKSVKDSILKEIFRKIPKVQIACSEEAGKKFYGRKGSYVIAHNGIDINRFVFSAELRKEYRNELKMNQEFLIIQIGRLSYPKNQMFSLKVLNECRRKGLSFKALIIGGGSDLQQLDDYIVQKGLQEYIQVLPPQEKIEAYYMAADLMLFPSVFEGLGIVAIESQVAGLPIICSEYIPQDVFLTDYIKKASIEHCEDWVRMIEDFMGMTINRKELSAIGQKNCEKRGYSIENTCCELVDIYRKIHT